MSNERIPPDHVAAVVTVLELREHPPLEPLPPAPLELVRWREPHPDRYRTLFKRVGAPWLWFSRLLLDDAALNAKTHAPATQVHAVVNRGGIEVGLLELSHPAADRCSLDFLALVPELTGQGHGRWLMARALALAWTPTVEVVRVHTCTLDHPAALRFYRSHGFVPVAREVEVFADPRVLGVLPRDAAPQVPLLA